MSDTIINTYKVLFSVNILHHYFLDNGRTVFLFDKTQQQPELSNYDVKQFLAVVPTASTSEKLKNLRALFRATSMGFLVAVPEQIEVKEELIFALLPTDPLFNNYTALALRGQKIQSCSYQEENETMYFRIKHNVFVLTNRDPKENLYLSGIIPNRPDEKNDYQAEEIFREVGGGVYQATADQAGSSFVEQLKEPLPNGFVSNADIPSKTLHDINFRGIELTAEMRDDVFALIQIDTNRSHFDEKSPVFEVHFKNRSTEWHYYNMQSKRYEPKFPPFWEPLTYSKRIDKLKATPDVITVEKGDKNDENEKDKIKKLISKIIP